MAQVNEAKYAARAAGQINTCCAPCQGKAAAYPCRLLPARHVAAKGWCGACARKA